MHVLLCAPILTVWITLLAVWSSLSFLKKIQAIVQTQEQMYAILKIEIAIFFKIYSISRNTLKFWSKWMIVEMHMLSQDHFCYKHDQEELPGKLYAKIKHLFPACITGIATRKVRYYCTPEINPQCDICVKTIYQGLH